MTVQWTVRAATDRAAEKRRNPARLFVAAVRPIPVRVTKYKKDGVFSILFVFLLFKPNRTPPHASADKFA